MVQGGGLGLFIWWRFRTALIGNLVWAYYVCPEIYQPLFKQWNKDEAFGEGLEKEIKSKV